MKVSSAYWWLRGEGKDLLLRLVSILPTSAGDWIRFKVMRHFFAGLGYGTVIRDHIRLTNPEKISIGEHCNLSERSFITGGGGVTLGNYVGLGPDVKIWSVNHRFDDPDVPWLTQGYDKKPVVIEDDVWLGANCFVMPGVTIGKGAIISAGSILMKSVPPYAIIAGNPGRVVGWRKRPDWLKDRVEMMSAINTTESDADSDSEEEANANVRAR